MTSTTRKLIVGLLDDRPFEEWWADHEAEFAGSPIPPLTAEQHARLVSLGLDVGPRDVTRGDEPDDEASVG